MRGLALPPKLSLPNMFVLLAVFPYHSCSFPFQCHKVAAPTKIPPFPQFVFYLPLLQQAISVASKRSSLEVLAHVSALQTEMRPPSLRNSWPLPYNSPITCIKEFGELVLEFSSPTGEPTLEAMTYPPQSVNTTCQEGQLSSHDPEMCLLKMVMPRSSVAPRTEFQLVVVALQIQIFGLQHDCSLHELKQRIFYIFCMFLLMVQPCSNENLIGNFFHPNFLVIKDQFCNISYVLREMFVVYNSSSFCVNISMSFLKIDSFISTNSLDYAISSLQALVLQHHFSFSFFKSR